MTALPTRHAAAIAVCVAGAAMAGGCADGSGPQPARASLPHSYSFVLTSSCGERNLIGSYRVVVRDDEVTSVANLDPNYPYRPKPADVPSLAGLLDLARSAEPDAVVELSQGPDGVPVSLSIDHDPDAVDDEECYRVSDLTELSGDRRSG